MPPAHVSAVVAGKTGMRIRFFPCLFLSFAAIACNREGADANFDDAGAEAQKAIAGNVDFVLSEDIFKRWERAQANLEKLPRGELDRAKDPGGNDPVDRGIKRLESSPAARRAIESTGITVRTFVLATVALAQAVKATQAGVPPTVGAIASNVRFVMAHSSRLSNRGTPGLWVPPAELSQEEIDYHSAMVIDSASGANSAAVQEPVQPQLQQTEESSPARDSGFGGAVIPPDRPRTDSLPSIFPNY